MKQWIMVIDVARCHDCNNCFMACKDEFVDNDFPPYSKSMPRHGHRWRDIDRVDRGKFPLIDIVYRSWNCMMCENAPCMEAAADAVYRRDDGIVIIDPEKSKGLRELPDACPYGAIYWNEELGIPQKCTFCAHLIDSGWEETRCSQICPTGATTFRAVDPDAIEKICEDEGLERYRDGLGTKPRVFYKNLCRFTKHFIAGSLILDGECCEGAVVTVKGNGADKSVESDGYGDFRVDFLDPGEYTVSIEYPGSKPVVRNVSLEVSCNLGDIEI